MPQSPRRRRWTIAASAAVAVVVAWAVFAVVVIAHPTLATDPGRADAVVVLGPSNQRVPQAVALARKVGARDIALSIGDFAIQQQTTCTQPGFTVLCFVPDPYSTQGEAAEIGALARANGWHSIAVIAARPQASRARWLIQRCYSGEIQLVAATDPSSSSAGADWAFQLIYQSAAWLKATVTLSCATTSRTTVATKPAAPASPLGAAPA